MNEDISLNGFTDINVSGQTSIYSAVLEAFDRIEQLQEAHISAALLAVSGMPSPQV